MDSENEFRDILSDKLNKEFSVDAANWQQARGLIDASREDKKRRPIVFFISGILLLIGGAVCFYFFSSPKNSNLLSEKKSNIPVVKEESFNEQNNNTQLTGPVASVRPTEESAETGNTNANLAKIKSTKNASDKNAAATKINAEVQISGGNNKKENENKTMIQATFSDRGKNELNFTKAEKKTSSKKPELRVQPNIIANDVPSVAETQTASTKNPEAGKEKESVAKNEMNASEEKINKDSVIVEPVIKNAPVVAKDPEPVEPVVTLSPLKDSVLKNPALVVKQDSAATQAEMALTSKKVYTQTLSVEAGLNYFIGWKNPGNRDAKGYDPIIGFNYSRIVTNKITGSFGANYYSVGHLSYSSDTSKVTRFKFGEENDVTVITPSKLHYLGFPLKLIYNYDENHSFGLGCNVGYLFNVAVKTETYAQRAGNTYDHVKSKDKGYMQGFKAFDTQFTLFYRRRIYKDLSVNAELMLGLVDVKDNLFFKSVGMNRNTGIRCTLVYELFKR